MNTTTTEICGAIAVGNGMGFVCALAPHDDSRKHEDHFHGRQTHPPFGPQTFVTYFTDKDVNRR